jgi:AbrB family looped-hinge helix DNA binding protein
MAIIGELRKRSQITIPKEIIVALGLKEGDKLTMEVEDGKIKITPVVIIPKDEAWIWTKEMQEAIAEGERESREGKLKAYDDVSRAFKEFGLDEGFEDLDNV